MDNYGVGKDVQPAKSACSSLRYEDDAKDRRKWMTNDGAERKIRRLLHIIYGYLIQEGFRLRQTVGLIEKKRLSS